MVIGAERDTGAVGEARLPVPDALNGIAKNFELARIHCAVFVGAGEMAQENLHIELLNWDIRYFARRDPEAVYAAVDHEMAWPAAALLPEPCLPNGVDHRPNAGLPGIGSVAGIERAVQDCKFICRHMVQNRFDLAPMRHEEVTAPSLAQSRQALIDPQAIAVRLYGSPHPRPAGHPVERPPVVRESPAVDIKPQSGGWGGNQAAVTE